MPLLQNNPFTTPQNYYLMIITICNYFLMHFFFRGARDVAFQQKQRASKLAHALTSLDNYLRSRTFMVGQRLTLADTYLSIDILPLFDIKLNGQPLIKAICPGNNLLHLNRWHRTIVNQKSFRNFYDPEKFNIDLVVQNQGNKQ